MGRPLASISPSLEGGLGRLAQSTAAPWPWWEPAAGWVPMGQEAQLDYLGIRAPVGVGKQWGPPWAVSKT